jgi:hypothetical protein
MMVGKVYDIIIGKPQSILHPVINMNPEGLFPSDVLKVIRKEQEKYRRTGRDSRKKVYITWIYYDIQYEGSSLYGRARGDALTRAKSVKRAKENLVKTLKKHGATDKQIKVAL